MATKAKIKEQPKTYTKYERGRIIGSRALQISQGAPLLIKFSEKELEELNYDPVSIAKKEYKAGLIQMDIIRPYPDTRHKDEEEKE